MTNTRSRALVAPALPLAVVRALDSLAVGDEVYGILADAVAHYGGDAPAWAIVPPLYWAAADCHNGQGSPLYGIYCGLVGVYFPGALEVGPDANAADAYAGLCALFLR